MSADVLERAFATTSKVLANLSPDQLDQPTPCASWDVRDLVNHIVNGAAWFAAAAESGTAPTSEGSEPDNTTGNLQATFERNAARAVAAFRAEGVMDQTLTLPWGPMPAPAFCLLASTDSFTHAWDLAKATGQSTDLDSELAEELMAFAQAAVPEGFRGPEPAPFAPIVEVPEGAPAADRLAGFLGRQP